MPWFIKRDRPDLIERFNVPLVEIPLLPTEVKGVAALTELGERVYSDGLASRASSHTPKEVAVG